MRRRDFFARVAGAVLGAPLAARLGLGANTTPYEVLDVTRVLEASCYDWTWAVINEAEFDRLTVGTRFCEVFSEEESWYPSEYMDARQGAGNGEETTP